MGTKKKWFLSVTAALAAVSAVGVVARVVYGPQEGSWVLVALFVASLVEWFLYTLWVRTIARAKDTIIIPVTFINATATIVAPWLYDMMKTYNPDGISYKLIGIIVYGLGGVVGAMLALRLRQNK